MQRASSENPGESAGALLALSNDLAGAVERAGRAVVAIYARPRVPSSGILWRSDVVVAADHTIKRDEEITVTLPDGRSVPASLAGRDLSTDLAVLKLQNTDQPAAEISDTASLRVGHLVLALGRSGGNSLGASLGVISTLSGAWRTWRGGHIDQFVRLDLAIYTGFSGSALVDASGRVVGLNTSGLARGMALAIPTSTVNGVAEELLVKGHIARGYLGLGMQPVVLSHALQKKLGLPTNSALIIVSVEPDGPAEKAGALIGDVLVALDGTPVSDTDDVQAKLGREYIGKELTASILRGGAVAKLVIQVGERPRKDK